jgi:hypothetical protein
MTNEELDKARSYAIGKMRFSEIHSIFNEIETTVKNFKYLFFILLTLFFIIGFIINWYFTMVMVKIREYIIKI